MATGTSLHASFDAPTPSFSDPSPSENHIGASAAHSPALSTTSSAESIDGRLQRPKLGSRKSSGTMIVSRNSAKIEMAPEEEEYDPDDVRSMSPRRTSEVINKLGEDARQRMIEQAKALQTSLMAIVDRVETVKSEHEKLEGGNKFLQSYIGELIQTSKITSSALPKGKGKGRKPLVLAVTALVLLVGLIHSLSTASAPRASLQALNRFRALEQQNVTRPLRIKKVSAIFGEHNDLYEAALKTHEKHNELHGYQMQTLRERIINNFWSKPAYLLSVLVEELAKPLDQRNDWLVWVDPATIILNPQVPLDIFLPSRDEENINLVGTHDTNGFNSGVFFLRVNAWALKMLVEVLAVPLTDNRHDLGLTKEQSALEAVLESAAFRSKTAYQPRTWFNALHVNGSFEGHVGDLLVHLPEVNGNKWTAMDHYLGNVTKRHNPWERKLSATGHLAEVAEYWSRMREGLQLLETAHTKNTDRRVNEAAQRLIFALDYETDHKEVMKDALNALRKLREAAARSQQLLDDRQTDRPIARSFPRASYYTLGLLGSTAQHHRAAPQRTPAQHHSAAPQRSTTAQHHHRTAPRTADPARTPPTRSAPQRGNMSTEYNYDDQGQFFPFFFVTVAGLVTLPITYSLLRSSTDLENTAPRIASSYTPEHVDLIDGQRRKQKRRERKIKRIVAAAVGWATMALMVYLMAVTTRSQPKIWDPYEILGIPMSATEKQIQSRYRRLSVTMHPDKAQPDASKNETLESVNERWVEVIKAYKALTDEDIRNNFIQYGNPDGKQSTSFGIALPQFLVTDGNGKYILLVYGALLGVLLPYFVGRWWYGSQKMTRENILVTSAGNLFKEYSERIDRNGVVNALSSGAEFRDILSGHKADTGSGQLEKRVLTDSLAEKDRQRVQDLDDGARRKTLALLWAYLGRVELDDATLNDGKSRAIPHLFLSSLPPPGRPD
ncbi:hypothetical protein MBLNU459_g6698t2 [Dothideomycetes sp. NU459]